MIEKNYLFFILFLGIASTSRSSLEASGSLYWACDSGVLVDNPCIGVMSFTGNQISQVVDLQKKISFVLAFALDSVSHNGYIIGGNDRSNLSLITVNLTTGISSFSSYSISIPEENDVLDAAFDRKTGQIFLVVFANILIPSIGNLQLFQLDPKYGKMVSVATVATSDTEYAYFSSSFSQAGTFYTILANSTGWWLFNFDTISGTVTQNSAPFGFGSAVYDNKMGGLIGNIFTSYNATNNLALLNPNSGNVTNLGIPFNSLYCIGVPHAGLDLVSNTYYTVCCYDQQCSNTTLTAIDSTSNLIRQSISLPSSQSALNFGFFLVHVIILLKKWF